MSDTPTVPTTPHARSAVNGMIIPLLPHQGGILHRFAQPENRLVIAGTSEPVAESERMVSDATPDPLLEQALQDNQQLQAKLEDQGRALALMQEQMAAMLQAQQATATATATAPQSPTPAATPAPVTAKSVKSPKQAQAPADAAEGAGAQPNLGGAGAPPMI